MDPVEVYGGAHGVACIEVHHHAVQVDHMFEAHGTKLEELKCLCANCHRVVHRLLKLEIDDPRPASANSKSVSAEDVRALAT
jgi:5-methylcytosine-specific restriction protein A